MTARIIRVVRCSTCGAQMFFAETPAGRRIPIDLEPRADGNLVIRRPASGKVIAVPAKDAQPEETVRHTSHFVTCPQAASHRRAR